MFLQGKKASLKLTHRTDISGEPNLYEWRSTKPGESGFYVRYWRRVPVGDDGGAFLVDATEQIIYLLLSRLSRSHARQRKDEQVAPPKRRMPEGMEPDVIADPDQPMAGNVLVVRRIGTVERLVRAGTFTRLHQNAADRFYVCYMVGVEGARQFAEEILPEVRTPGWMKAEMSLRKALAMREYQGVATVLGNPLTNAVRHAVIDDATIDELAGKLRWDKRKTVGYLQAGLEAVAGHFRI